MNTAQDLKGIKMAWLLGMTQAQKAAKALAKQRAASAKALEKKNKAIKKAMKKSI